MKRRSFITLLGGAAAAWPLAAHSQQAERMRRIAVLMSLAADDSEAARRLTAFVQGLQQLGWTDGRNVRIEYRWGAGDPERIRKYAAELVALAPDALFAIQSGPVASLHQATRTVPIVFAQVGDPIALGFVSSLARSGDNITGFALTERAIAVKRLELLKQIAPHVTRVVFMYDPANPTSSKFIYRDRGRSSIAWGKCVRCPGAQRRRDRGRYQYTRARAERRSDRALDRSRCRSS